MNYVAQETCSPPELMSAINGDSMSPEQRAELNDSTQLVCTAICAAIFAVLLSTVGNTVLTWSVFAVGVIFFCSEVLALAMPKSVRNRVFANCVRGDGSWSAGRASLERRSLGKFKMNLVFVLLICTAPSLFGLWMLNREVVPIGMGFDAMVTRTIAPQQWNSDRPKIERQFDRWQKSSSFASDVDLGQHKWAIRSFWPLIFVFGILWCTTVFTIVTKYYIYCISQLNLSAVARAHDYRWRDLAMDASFVGNRNGDSVRRKRKRRKQTSELA